MESAAAEVSLYQFRWSHSQTRSGDTEFVLAVSKTEAWRQRLFVPSYGVGEAARYSHISPQTVTHWRRGLPGYEKGQRLSYLDLIEVAVIAAFRKSGVPLDRIRKARAYATDELDSQHPFVQYRWQTEGFHMMLRLSEIDGDASVDNLVVADEKGQIAWPETVSERFSHFDYDDTGLVMVWHVLGRDNLVTIDPRMRFGTPTVEGVPTWILEGRWQAGERYRRHGG